MGTVLARIAQCQLSSLANPVSAADRTQRSFQAKGYSYSYSRYEFSHKQEQYLHECKSRMGVATHGSTPPTVLRQATTVLVLI